jgi:predicted peptidase
VEASDLTFLESPSLIDPLIEFENIIMKCIALSALLFVCASQTFLRAEEFWDEFSATVTKEVGAHYLIVKPDDFDTEKKYPLMIFLHGRGESGNDLDKVKIHGPFEKVKELNLPFIIVAPQTPLDERWDIDMLSALVDHLLEQLPVDRGRVYLTGLSLGGFGTWDLAIRRPEVFAAVAPICGQGKPSQAKQMADVPVWAFHGAKDSTVALKGSTDMINALYDLGSDARLTVYPDAGHDSWEATYDNPKLYEWFLSHRKQSK